MPDAWLCITPERELKTSLLMEALHKGWPDAAIIHGAPPDDGKPFFVWGQQMLGFDLLKQFYDTDRPFWHIDNGWIWSAKGKAEGYYRFTYRGLVPHMLVNPLPRPVSVDLAPWRQTGRHVLLCQPGPSFGAAIGLDMGEWNRTIRRRLYKATKRMIVVREKHARRPLASDLRNCWAVVTHSSGVAVDAVLAGIPVFVEPTCPAAAVGSYDLALIEYPAMPDRTNWLASLLCQQFTIDEMADGTAFRHLMQVKEQVDG